MKRIVLSGLVAAALSSLAFGGGDYVPVTPVSVDSWSGCYVGAQIGGNWGDADVNLKDGNGNLVRNFSLSPDGWNTGLYAGCNWLLDNNILFGVEGDWNYVDADDEYKWDGDYGGYPGTYLYKVEQDWDASLRLRAGYVIDDKWMPYITGGLAWAKVKGTFTISPGLMNPLNGGSDTDSDIMTGWTIGAGIEMKIDENWHARLQYRYTDYGDTDLSHTIEGTDYKAHVDYNNHMIQLGISYRF